MSVDLHEEAGGKIIVIKLTGKLAKEDYRQFSPLPTSINTGLTLECVIGLEEEKRELRLGQRVRVRVLADQKSTDPR
jgi:hypothetical protein